MQLSFEFYLTTCLVTSEHQPCISPPTSHDQIVTGAIGKPRFVSLVIFFFFTSVKFCLHHYFFSTPVKRWYKHEHV